MKENWVEPGRLVKIGPLKTLTRAPWLSFSSEQSRVLEATNDTVVELLQEGDTVRGRSWITVWVGRHSVQERVQKWNMTYTTYTNTNRKNGVCAGGTGAGRLAVGQECDAFEPTALARSKGLRREAAGVRHQEASRVLPAQAGLGGAGADE